MNYYNYFTEIEEHFVRRRGKHLYVSPLDWSLIATWRDTRIPLNVALRGIDIAMDGFLSRQARIQSRVNTLFFCHDAVMSEYARYVESHLGDAEQNDGADPPLQGQGKSSDDLPAKPEVLELVQKRISEIETLRSKHPCGSPVYEAAERVLGRLGEIRDSIDAQKEIEYESLERDLSLADESLVEQLGSTLDPDQVASWQKEARTELKTYRKQLPKETYQKILRNYLRGKIHNFFRVGELSLFQL